MNRVTAMTTKQWKDRLRIQRDELLQLKKLVDESNLEFHERIDTILERINIAISS
jgi:hypothetical protein